MKASKRRRLQNETVDGSIVVEHAKACVRGRFGGGGEVRPTRTRNRERRASRAGAGFS